MIRGKGDKAALNPVSNWSFCANDDAAADGQPID
jgi:hypothetical protein